MSEIIISSEPIYLSKEESEKAKKSLLEDPNTPEAVKEVIRKDPTDVYKKYSHKFTQLALRMLF